jgi:hypothetical protein
LATLLGPSVVSAHGIPCDVWTVKPDGSNLQRIAELGAKDASLTWSPDGSQLFVLATASSFLVTLTGEVLQLPTVHGAGGASWVSP